jgi:hypothetical protein
MGSQSGGAGECAWWRCFLRLARKRFLLTRINRAPTLVFAARFRVEAHGVISANMLIQVFVGRQRGIRSYENFHRLATIVGLLRQIGAAPALLVAA